MTKAEAIEELRAAVARRDWKRAGFIVDGLRIVAGWRYADFAKLLGADQWEAAAQEIDAAESGESDD